MRNPRIRWMFVCSFVVLRKCGVAYNKRTSSQPLRSLLPTLGRKNDISVIPFLETKTNTEVVCQEKLTWRS